MTLDPAPAPTVEVAPSPEPQPFVSIFDTLPDVPDWQTPDEPDLVAVPAPTTPASDLTTRTRAERHPLVDRLRRATTDAQRLRVLRAALDGLADLDRATRRAVLSAVPDGWARRRALEAMLQAQVVATAEVPDLVRMLASPMARTWVCASAVEADMLRIDEVDGLVDPRAAARLRRRYA